MPFEKHIARSACYEVQSSVSPKDPIAAPQRRGSSEASVLTDQGLGSADEAPH